MTFVSFVCVVVRHRITVVQSTHVAISDDDRSVVGVTSVHTRMFVLRNESRQEIQVYNTKSFKQQQIIQVDGLSDYTSDSGLTSCVTNNCLYVSDWKQDTVYKVELSANNKVSKWSVGSQPRDLSINAKCNLIVTCYNWPHAGKIQEYNTTSGSLVREVSLKSNDAVLCPFHAIQLNSDHFVVSCVNVTKNCVHDVIEVDTKGRVVISYRNQLKSTTQHKFTLPRRLSVDKSNKFILEADMWNNRIVILDRSLKSCARELNITSVDSGLQGPSCLYFNVSQNRLFVGEQSGQRRVLMFDNVI
jgi:6-phosphogluconolactonase (cycloisomerase 2 family)